MRVLGRIRLSRLTEESTSEARQRESIEQWAALHGHKVVDWAIDLDVSGSISPFEAPELGGWLTEAGMSQWDILCAYRLDRIARRVIPLNALFGVIMDNDKSLVSVSESIDLSTWVGRMVANVIAGVAEGELEAITERTQASRKKLRELGRWSGGTVPYGYTTVKRDGGWYFEIDPETSKTVRWMVQEASEHRSIRSLADELNKSGLPSPRGGSWTAETITRMLRSRWIIGQAEHKGRVVTDAEGLPLQRMDPLITYDEWKRVNAVLDTRLRPKKNNNGTGLLSGVAFCDMCKKPMYRFVMKKRGYSYTYWRCGGSVKKTTDCKAVSVTASELEGFVYLQLMDEIGDDERRKRVYVQGEDQSSELDQVSDAIETIRKEKDLGLYEGDTDAYLERLQKLVERRKVLQESPVIKSGYQLRGLGETYREAWTRMSDNERREMLLDSGIRVWVTAKPGEVYHPHVEVPPDIKERIHA